MLSNEWIAVDWGSSRLRAWAMSGDELRDEFSSDQGMLSLSQGEFEGALLRVIEPWLGRHRVLVIACGMVGARQGWSEAPYQSVPCSPRPLILTRVAALDPRLDVRIVPGICQTSHPDVMRGEET